MADRLLKYATKQRSDKREYNHFSRSDIENIIARKQGSLAVTGHTLAVAARGRRRLRRVGGRRKPPAVSMQDLDVPKEFSSKARWDCWVWAGLGRFAAMPWGREAPF